MTSTDIDEAVDFPSLYYPGSRNRFPIEVQAQHQREAYERLHASLVWAVKHIAIRELDSDYATVLPDWDDETMARYEQAQALANPNPLTRPHR